MIVLEATAVHESGRLTAHTLAGYQSEIVAGYRRVVEAVRPHGTRLFVQLFHGGRELIASPPGRPRSRRRRSRASASTSSPGPSPRPRSASSSPGTRAPRSSRPRAGSTGSSSRPPTATSSRSSSPRGSTSARTSGRRGRSSSSPSWRQYGTRHPSSRSASGFRPTPRPPWRSRPSSPDRGLPLDRPRRLVHLSRLDGNRPAAAGRGERHRRVRGAVPGRASSDRDLAHRRPRFGRQAHRGRSRRRSRDDACAHHRSRSPAQGRGRARWTTSSAASAATPASRITTPRSRSRAPRTLAPAAS